MGKRWLPLESNPDVLNNFTSALGLDISQYSFHDVFGLDEVRLPVPVPTMVAIAVHCDFGGAFLPPNHSSLPLCCTVTV